MAPFLVISARNKMKVK